MESVAHANLKRLAMLYLRSMGFVAIASEVRCPIARHIVDVAAFGFRESDRHNAAAETPVSLFLSSNHLRHEPRAPTRLRPRTVIIECKQDRSDFLRERSDLEDLIDRRQRLAARRARIESHHEYRWDIGKGHLFTGIAGNGPPPTIGRDHRRIAKSIDRIDARIHTGAKFSRMARYRLADRMYIFAPERMIRPRELPAGWGLIECPRAAIQSRWESLLNSIDQTNHPNASPALPIRVVRKAASLASPPRFRRRLLLRIAQASTRATISSLRRNQ